MASDAKLIVGVDAGGTRTRALVADAGERELGRAEAGGVDWLGQPHGSAEQLVMALRGALTAAEVGAHAIGLVCVGSAGADRRSVSTRIERVVSSSLAGARVRVVPDAALGLASAGLSSGVAVVVGTGSIVYGRSPTGKTARAGGWGPLLGDEGSAYDIGRQAAVAALSAEDGRGEGTLLVSALMRACGLDDIRSIVDWLAAASSSRVALASLAPCVSQAADQGDRVALGILSRAGLELGRAAAAVVRRLGMQGEQVDLVPVGGVFAAGDPFIAPLIRVVGREAHVRVIHPTDDPALGAIRLARGATQW